MFFFDQIIGRLLVRLRLTLSHGLTRRANWLRLLNEGKRGRGQRLVDVTDLLAEVPRLCKAPIQVAPDAKCATIASQLVG